MLANERNMRKFTGHGKPVRCKSGINPHLIRTNLKQRMQRNIV